MKTIKRITIISMVFRLIFLLPLGLFADPPGMPGGHGTNGDAPSGGGAPIGSGTTFLIILGLAYLDRKMGSSFSVKDKANL